MSGKVLPSVYLHPDTSSDMKRSSIEAFSTDTVVPRPAKTLKPTPLFPWSVIFGNKSIPLCDDTLLYIMEFLEQSEIHNVGMVCKDLLRIKRLTNHLQYYFVYNSRMAWHSQRQINLRALVINGVRDSQLFFSDLPEYVFIGHYSSLHPTNTYRGMLTGGECTASYPKVKTLFIEEAPVSVDWGVFPNLEELFIITSQLDLNIDTLWKCQKLKKVIVKIRKGIVYVKDKRVTKLPNLEVLAVSGGMSKGKFTTVSPHLHTCVFYSKPVEYYNGVYYSTMFPGDDEADFDRLLRRHHNPPKIITSNVDRM